MPKAIARGAGTDHRGSTPPALSRAAAGGKATRRRGRSEPGQKPPLAAATNGHGGWREAPGPQGRKQR